MCVWVHVYVFSCMLLVSMVSGLLILIEENQGTMRSIQGEKRPIGDSSSTVQWCASRCWVITLRYIPIGYQPKQSYLDIVIFSSMNLFPRIRIRRNHSLSQTQLFLFYCNRSNEFLWGEPTSTKLITRYLFLSYTQSLMERIFLYFFSSGFTWRYLHCNNLY